MTKRSGDLASAPLIWVKPDTEIWRAFTIMLENKIRRLPVIQRGKLAGIVTERDLLKWVIEVTYEPNIPDNIKVLLTRDH